MILYGNIPMKAAIQDICGKPLINTPHIVAVKMKTYPHMVAAKQVLSPHLVAIIINHYLNR